MLACPRHSAAASGTDSAQHMNDDNNSVCKLLLLLPHRSAAASGTDSVQCFTNASDDDDKQIITSD